MKKSLLYYPPKNSSSNKELNISAWKSCVDHYEKRNYNKSFIHFLNYLDENIYNNFSNPEKTVFTVPHGSSIVILKIKDTHLYIEAPFVKLPEAKFIPILRKSSEINFAYMTLPNIKLKDDVMTFMYDMPLELCNPWKLYDILRNITFNADKYDDEFIAKFGAKRITEPMVRDYKPKKLNKFLKACNSIASTAIENIQYFESKRNLNNAVDCVFIGIGQIRLHCNPTGILLNKMNETIDVLYDRNNNMVDKIKAGRQFFKFVEEIEIDDFAEYCTSTFSLIPGKRSVNRNYIENWVESHLNDAAGAYSAENYINSAFSSYYALYYALSYFNLDKKDEKVIFYGLRESSEKKWDEAAEILLNTLDFFYQNTGEDFEFNNDCDEGDDENNQDNEKKYMKMISKFLSEFGEKN